MAIVWDGGGADLAWSNPLNWSTDMVPGSGDTVVIDLPASDITVNLTENVTIAGLQSEEGLRIASGALTVNEPSYVRGAFELTSGATLVADGPSASFVATGTATVQRANLRTFGGGVIDLPTLATYYGAGDTHSEWKAIGKGSRISASAMTSGTGASRHGEWVLAASQGGRIELDALTQISGTTQITATGADSLGAGSVISLSALDSWADHNRWRESYLTWHSGGIVDVSSLRSLTTVGLRAQNGQVMTLPALETYAGTNDGFSTLSATGTGSELVLPQLTTMSGIGRHGSVRVESAAGGTINMVSLGKITGGTVEVIAAGSDAAGNGSAINLSGLQSWADYNQFRESFLTWHSGGAVDISSLRSLTTVGIRAQGGQVMTFPALEIYSGANDGASTIRAVGAGSRIEFPQLTTMSGVGRHGHVLIEASDGGEINMEALQSITGGAVNVRATGGDSAIDLSMLDSWTDNNSWRESALRWNSSASVDIGAITALGGVSVYAEPGQTIRLPNLETYSGTHDNSSRLEATGEGSRLEFPLLQTLNGVTRHGRVDVVATGGGVIDISAVTSIPTGAVYMGAAGADAFGASSHVDASSLTLWVHNNIFQVSTLRAANQGIVSLASSSTTLTRVRAEALDSGVIQGGELNLTTNSILEGDGTVAMDVVNQSSVRPGSGIGILAIDGDYTQLGSGSLSVQLGGIAAGTEYDRLQVSGAASLDGTLIVSLANGYSPNDGDSFQILNFGSRSGDFATKNGLNLPGNVILSETYEPNSLKLQAVGNDPPTIDSLTAMPDPVLQSADLTLAASNVFDANNNVDAIRFYRDADGNGLLDVGVDPLLGTDTAGSDGWNLTLPAEFPSGVHVFFAQAEDATSNFSNVVSAPVRIDPAVFWDGEAGDNNWHTALNWSTDAVPTSTDNVVINVAGDLTVNHLSGATTVGSLQSNESLNISGGSVTVTEQSVVSGALTMSPGTTLIASGVSAALNATGSTELDGASLRAENGGSISLPNLLAYESTVNASIKAVGADSAIDLSGATKLTGPNNQYYALNVLADSGGRIDVSGVTTLSNRINSVARGTGSAIDLNSAVTLETSTLAITAKAPWALRLEATDGGTLNTPNVATLHGVSLVASGGSNIDMSTATTYEGGDRLRNTIQASGSSSVNLSGITSFVGATGNWAGPTFTRVEALGGGMIDLSNAPAISHQTDLYASGSGSVIDLAGTTALQGGPGILDGIFPYSLRLRVDDSGAINTPNVQTLKATSLIASGGSDLIMPTATSYVGGDRLRNSIQANGSGSTIDLSGITTFAGATGNWYGPVFTTVEALDGGTINLSGAATISNQTDLYASGTGSVIDLAGTTALQGGPGILDGIFPYSLRLRVDDNGTINTPNVQTLEATSLIASGGSDILMPTATTYEGGDRLRNTIQATGPGSYIDLSGVTHFVGGSGSWFGPVRLGIQALDGGVVKLNATNDVSGNVDLLASNAGVLELSTTESIFHGSTTLNATTGRIDAGSLTFLDTASVTAEGFFDADVVNEGILEVGPGVKTLSIQGDFSQTTTGVLNLQLAGTQSSQYDSLSVTGRSALEGTLNVTLANGFIPAAGDSFEIVTFDTRSCDFSTKNGLDLGGGLHLAASFSASALTLNAGSTPDSGQKCLTIPDFDNISVGPDPAKAGDPLSITFKVDVPLMANPTVEVGGNPAAFVSQSGSIFTYSYLVSGAEPEGVVDVTLTATSAADGGVGNETVQTTFDFTDPTITAISSSPDPVDVAQTLAIEVQSNELLSTSTVVNIGGLPATLSSSNGLIYTFTRVITGGEGIGAVPIEIAAVDIAGNTSTTTDAVTIFSGGLAVSASSIELSDTTPRVGDLVSATISIENSGVFPAFNVPVDVALFEPGGARSLGSFTIPSIPAGGSTSLPVDFDIQTDGVQVLRVHVDPLDVVLEDDNLDNVATRSLIVGNVSSDAITVDATLSTTTGLPGSPLSIAGTASYDPALNPAGPVAGGSVTVRIPSINFVGTTLTDASGSFAFDYHMPALPGNYVTDARVSDITSEGAVILPFTVSLPPSGIDLFTSSNYLTFSTSSPVIGQPVTISTTIFNVGGDPLPGSADVHFYDGETLIGTATTGSLASGASATAAIAHSFADAGTHLIRVEVDPNEGVAELRETNNVGMGEVVVVDTLPDLAPTDLVFSDTTPSTAQTVTITAVVRNLGGTEASDVIVQFFDGGNPIGAGIIPHIPATGGTASIAIQTILSSVGAHDISVVIDPANSILEIDEDNNVRVESVVAHAPAADLAPSAITFSNPSPVAGDVVDVTTTVRNQGEIASDSFDVRFLKDGIQFGVVTVAGLAVGQSSPLSFPTSFSAAGSHHVTVEVDWGDAISELSETNNIATSTFQVLSTPLSDLTLDANEFSLSDLNPNTGELVTISAPIRNVGATVASGVNVELQIDGTVIATTTTTPANIGTGASAIAEFQFATPVGDGFHLLEMVIDPGNGIAESNENNNRDFLFFLVGDFPDLLPADITFSNATPLEGEVINVFATLQNDGDSRAESIVVRLFDGSETLGQFVVPALEVGESQVVSFPLDTDGRAGNRLIQVLADPDGMITESNESNNLVSTILAVSPGDVTPPTTSAVLTPNANAAGWNNTDVDLVLSAADNSGGSGVSILTYSVNGGPSQTTFGDTVAHSFNEEGVHTITFQAIDIDQNVEPVQVVQIRIDKTNPIAVHNGPFSVDEGSSILLGGTASTDTLSGVATSAWSLDGDDIFDDGDPATFVGMDGPSLHDVVLRVVDAAGNETIVTTQVSVDNVAPTFDAGANEVLLPAQSGLFTRSSINFFDPGTDVWSGTVNFGDGSGDQSLMINQADQDFDLAHTYIADGTYTVTITLRDGDLGEANDSFDVEVILNTPPEARDDLVETDEETIFTFDVLADNGNGPDIDDQNNVVPSLTSLLSVPRRGILVNNNDGTFSYNPNGQFEFLGSGQSASETFEYRIEDAFGATDTAYVTITIGGINDAPQLIVPPPQTILEDTTETISGIDVDDVDNPELALNVSVPNGTATLSAVATGGAVVTGDGTAALTVAGTIADVNATVGSLALSPAANLNGDIELVVSLDDGSVAVVNSVLISVTPVNDAPVNSFPSSVVGNEETLIPIPESAITDVDIDETAPPNNTIQASLSVNYGSLLLGSAAGLTGDMDGSDGVIQLNGSLTDVNAALTTLAYQGNVDYVGVDTLTIVTDDLGNSGGGGSRTDTDTVAIEVRNLVDVAGRVFDDLDNDGVYDPADGDAGIGGVRIEVWDDAMSTLYGSTKTAADGTYSLNTNLEGGTYQIVEVIDELTGLGLLDGKESAGNLGGSVDNNHDRNKISGIHVGPAGSTADAVDYLFAEIRPSDLFGRVWRDFNDDGEINFGEPGIEGVSITLSGTDDRGNPVSESDATLADGSYGFFNLRPGSYAIDEHQPADFADGKESLGEVTDLGIPSAIGVDGVIDGNDRFAGVVLVPGSEGDRYNYGNRPTEIGAVGNDGTAGIGFWHNKNGQALIRSLNGGENSTQLGDWLAATFPRMYGEGAFYDAGIGADQDMSLGGKTNTEIGEIFMYLHKRNRKSAAAGGPPKLDAQVMATALSTYVTSETLAGGNVAASYGFTTSADGIGYASFEVLSVLTSSEAASLGLTPDANGHVKIIDILIAANDYAHKGLLYDQDGDQAIDGLELQLRQLAHALFSAINEGSEL